MARSVEQIIHRLKELGAPPLLIDLATGTEAPGELKHELQRPTTFYKLGSRSPGKMPFGDQLIPLWETNGDLLTAYVDAQPPFVIRYYYEDAPNQYEVVGKSIMEAIENRLAWLHCETGADAADMIAAARACGHPDPEKFVQSLQTDYGTD